MLSSLLLYLLFAAGGIFIGAKVLKPDREYKWIGRLQTAALMILIFTMGINIGADERVLSSVGTLGVRALIVSLCAVAGSVLLFSPEESSWDWIERAERFLTRKTKPVLWRR